jgi:N-acetylglucosaminyldiphosphoundecaprenol N-acetyl-beta-D-mannosaminyltransferase
MQQRGLEWLYRLAQEPARLWKRYVTSLPLFVLLTALELIRLRLGGARTTGAGGG